MDGHKLKGKKIGFALCGSFCTFSKAFAQLERLISEGAEVTAVMSFNAAGYPLRKSRRPHRISRKCHGEKGHQNY